jgi:hypothetical protein
MITNLEDGYNYVLPMILTDYIVVVMFEYWNNQSMKIMSVVELHWRVTKKNKQLTRVYGTVKQS